MKELLSWVESLGARIELNGDKLRLIAPKLSKAEVSTLIETLRPRKAEIIEYLSKSVERKVIGSGEWGDPVREVFDTYEVEPGVNIHSPRTSAEFLEWRKSMEAKRGNKH